MQGFELEIVLRIIDEAFDHKSWHGTNLYGSVRGLDLSEVAWRPHPNRHNIWEIVMHVAYWKYAVRRKLLNEPRGSFPLKGSNWFKRPMEKENDLEHWKSDVAVLVSAHRSLRDVIECLKLGQLNKAPAGSRIPTLTFLTGVAAHDLYHAGQIQLLKRLYRGRASARDTWRS